ncbi:hypothetical protein MKX03_024296 [Papaver bracteatum]|nr:hypothetical protein MKX03_024296 [Papaver bracteatum]
MAAPSTKCFLVTGPPGVGKTTLVMKVLETLRASNPNLKAQGFYTSEIRQGMERVGFEVVTLDGRKAPLASTTISRSNSTRQLSVSLSLEFVVFRLKHGVCFFFVINSSAESRRWPSVGRFKVDITSFESLALPELQVKEDTDLFIIDEVGKMELFSSSFFPAVSRVLESNIPILATIPIPKFGRDIPEVARMRHHPGATIFMINTRNREAVKEQIYTQLVDVLRRT